MINILFDDIIDILLKKFHKFDYLFNLLYVNKHFNLKTKYTLKYHFTKLNNYLNDTTDKKNQNIKIYINISTNLFNNKILNFKKFNNNYYNNIISLQISNLIKLLLLFNEYYSNISVNHIKIINLKELVLFINHELNHENYFPFIIINLQNNCTIFIEYSIYYKKYRLKLKYKHTDISMYKSIVELDIIDLFSFSKKKLLNMYL